jgi:hypothetical protein
MFYLNFLPKMKKVFVMLIAICLCAGLSAQKREGNVITVQGHPHELLTKHAAANPGVTSPTLRAGTGTVTNIDPDEVFCWVGCTESIYPVVSIDTAYLLVKWIKNPSDSTSASRILLWGYQWVSEYTHPVYGNIEVKKYAIDMVRAVGNYDCRFSVLLQNTGAGNFTAGGFGYNSFAQTCVIPDFNLSGARTDSLILFHYTGEDPNCIFPANQYAVPTTPNDSVLVHQAIVASRNTGVIKHPLDAAYSYPAYDYDYWTRPWDLNYLWQAGWYKNYWAFYSKAGLTGDFDYAPGNNTITTQQIGATQRAIYFIYAYLDPTFSTPVYWDGDYESVESCACAPCNGLCNPASN